MDGISIPSGKIAFSLRRGDLNLKPCHGTSGRAVNLRPYRSRTGSQRLLAAPFQGSVTTVLFSAGSRRSTAYPSSRIALTTPSTCQGWLEQAGKYFVHDRLSLRIVGIEGSMTDR